VRGVHAPGETRRGGSGAAAVRPDRNRRGRALAAGPGPPGGETGGGDARLRPIRGDEPARTGKGPGASSLLPYRTAGCGRRCAARRRSVCQPDREHDFTREQWLRNWEARVGVLPGREKKMVRVRGRAPIRRGPRQNREREGRTARDATWTQRTETCRSAAGVGQGRRRQWLPAGTSERRRRSSAARGNGASRSNRLKRAS
jgi:hypothetical protein